MHTYDSVCIYMRQYRYMNVCVRSMYVCVCGRLRLCMREQQRQVCKEHQTSRNFQCIFPSATQLVVSSTASSFSLYPSILHRNAYNYTHTHVHTQGKHLHTQACTHKRRTPTRTLMYIHKVCIYTHKHVHIKDVHLRAHSCTYTKRAPTHTSMYT